MKRMTCRHCHGPLDLVLIDLGSAPPSNAYLSEHALNQRNLGAPCPVRRARNYMAWPVATTYAVTRRELLIKRFQRGRQVFHPMLYDYVAGVHNATRGAVKAIPKIGFISTRNYNHSYIRSTDKLFFVRQNELVLETVNILREDLIESGVVEPSKAQALAEKFMLGMIAERCGRQVYLRSGFTDSRCYLAKGVQVQLRLFHELFRPGSDVRQRFQNKIEFIAKALARNAASTDNLHEPGRYDSIEAQTTKRDGMSRVAGAGERPTARRPNRRRVGVAVGLELDLDPGSLLSLNAEDGDDHG